ncbi:hypothetical protein ERYAMS2_01595 [Erysipelothrix amsterdamensis]|uniref:Phage abortive infection protein n=1 Tax=Erysipelothrix amsterdamensis TaxID=2929157 RepID=A0AAU9VJK4_9FIRM|nr:hypothetical protein ERYAMS_01300 [Erysipelothrix sp. A18Y020d]CAH2763174.1 hypothetical protein ERYAMS2_01595 [Erysipelothrix sp. A18Y020d]
MTASIYILNIMDSYQIVVAIISLSGVLLSSLFGYISSYLGRKQSADTELKKIKENHQKQIDQEKKLEKDTKLRIVLQELTEGYYALNYDQSIPGTYFNTSEGQEIFNRVMSFITAYGDEQSVQTTIYLQKAIFGSHLLSTYYDRLSEYVQDDLTYTIDWIRYETNALTSILIAQLRYDISTELLNPKDLMMVKYNNDNPVLRDFFESGVDLFIEMLQLEHFYPYIEKHTALKEKTYSN